LSARPERVGEAGRHFATNHTADATDGPAAPGRGRVVAGVDDAV
jgi:hypothetical protein